MNKRILVCGGRNFEDFLFMQGTLDTLAKWFDPAFCIIHGGARGADMLAHRWATFRGCPTIMMHANWQCYDKAAGMMRNQWMIDYAHPDLVIAFPGGSGTAGMVALAKKANILVHEVIREG